MIYQNYYLGHSQAVRQRFWYRVLGSNPVPQPLTMKNIFKNLKFNTQIFFSLFQKEDLKELFKILRRIKMIQRSCNVCWRMREKLP